MYLGAKVLALITGVGFIHSLTPGFPLVADTSRQVLFLLLLHLYIHIYCA